MTKKRMIILFPILFLVVLGILFLGTKFVYINGIGCIIYERFHVYCPGCGISRSLMYLMRGDIFKSIRFYPTLYFLLTYIIYKYIVLIVSFIKKKDFGFYRLDMILLIAIPVSAIIHCIYLNFV